jgi:predicted RNA binding protein YcfA (HicA-like mRNA interferase family)
MPKPRRLSGDEVVSIFGNVGFRVASQRGSRITLVRATPSGRQILTIPAHQEMDTGTLRAIIRQASRFVAADELHPHFDSQASIGDCRPRRSASERPQDGVEHEVEGRASVIRQEPPDEVAALLQQLVFAAVAPAHDGVPEMLGAIQLDRDTRIRAQRINLQASSPVEGADRGLPLACFEYEP